ncbi:transport permease protein [Planomonospora parontospora subsp. parontospora]|uniref:Transport permease protein n=2 Tax=Planomonospora parontospora TaxID=58119 RepID=A0AA37F5A1_9ACTN|nr:ABC transporter permease [Planomonospora parontospora]GGK71399.1 transport permease protein [Planomonospora parontospora]GII09682.1 transport permease protein [Planomonospora parontospora subsp. parontospora]
MSQPESAIADAQAGGPSDGTPAKGQEPLAELAARHGLRRAIARPSLPAYLRQLWERRHFVMTYATSRNVSKYSNSALGQLWQVLTPLLNAAIYYLMFGLILGTSKGIENYPAFLITGMFVFTYTQRAVTGGAKSISGNLSLIRALHFPRAALPLAYTIQEFQQLMISMGVLVVLVLVTGEPITWLWLLVPVALLLQTMFNIGASLVLARVGATARDLNQLLPFIMRTWLYASGVFFSIGDKVGSAENIPGWVADVMYFNPAAAYIELMRDLLMTSHAPRPYIWSVCVFWALFTLIGGFWYFWRAEEKYGRG